MGRRCGRFRAGDAAAVRRPSVPGDHRGVREPRPGALLRDADQYEAAARNLRRRQPTFSCSPLLFKLAAAKVEVPDGLPSFVNWQDRFSDFTSNDLERYLTERTVKGNLLSYLTAELKSTSPHSPVYMAKMIDNFWELAQRDVEAWKTNHGDHPTVAAALARRYTALRIGRRPSGSAGVYRQGAGLVGL